MPRRPSSSAPRRPSASRPRGPSAFRPRGPSAFRPRGPSAFRPRGPSTRRGPSTERGQASLEWIVVVGVVAVAMSAALAGALPGAEAVPRAVASTFERAFCLVAGGDCLGEGGPRPCVVASNEHSRERRASVMVLRFGDGRSVLREERSDRTVAITVVDDARLGAGVLWGAELTRNGKGFKASASIRGDGRGGQGRRFVVRDRAAADRLVKLLEQESGGVGRLVPADYHGPVPDETWSFLGRGADADATLRAAKLSARAGLSRSAIAGLRERQRTGERTLLLRADGEILAALAAPLSKLGIGTLGSAALELSLDSRGRPSALTVRGARGVDGTLKVGTLTSGGGDLLEAEARLDLADPAVRAAVGELTSALGDLDPGRALAAARAVGSRLIDRARVDLRLYATTRTGKVTGATGGFLLKVGAETEEVTRTARLVDAAGREPGLGWARRIDCVGVT